MGLLGRIRKSGDPVSDSSRLRQVEVSTFLRTVRRADSDAWFTLLLNGTQVTLPRYTLLTMGHCIHFDGEDMAQILIEDQQSRLLWSELYGRPAVFIDIGAAAGTMTLPFAVMANNDHLPLRIFAFEPSRTARSTLLDSLRKNGAEPMVTVFDRALSKVAGEGLFHEFPLSSNPLHAPFFPETSRLTVPSDRLDAMLGDNYEVAVERLDSFLDKFAIAPSEVVVVKVDVEGFEAHILEGGRSFIQRYQPYFIIELHSVPGQNITSEEHCRNILAPLGYSCETREGFMECRAKRK